MNELWIDKKGRHSSFIWHTVRLQLVIYWSAHSTSEKERKMNCVKGMNSHSIGMIVNWIRNDNDFDYFNGTSSTLEFETFTFLILLVSVSNVKNAPASLLKWRFQVPHWEFYGMHDVASNWYKWNPSKSRFVNSCIAPTMAIFVHLNNVWNIAREMGTVVKFSKRSDDDREQCRKVLVAIEQVLPW